jgi:GNAT superfamily N-acetyltransferase
MWRAATGRDDDVLVALSLRLHREDPGPSPIDARQVRETLATLRREPWRGRAVVLDVGGQVVGYALLVSYWSNELGGEVCAIDELFVAADHRGRGHGSRLIETAGRGALWPAPAVALALGTTPANAGARRLYERLGFRVVGLSLVKPLG